MTSKSVFEGEIDLNSMYMVDYPAKTKPISPRLRPTDDDCLIVGVSRDVLRARDVPKKYPDVLCPLEKEYYKKAIDRIVKEHPKLAKKYNLTEDIDPIPIEHEGHDVKRTEYLVKYCSRELPFMSVNLVRRARALQTLKLPDDVFIPDTTYLGSFRDPGPEKCINPNNNSMRPKFDNSLTTELRRILRVQTGETVYSVVHGLLAKVVLDKNPFGPPREEPKYGRWKNPFDYTYRI